MGLIFARDITDLTEAYKNLLEASKSSAMDSSYQRRDLLLAIDETIEKYREQLKEDDNK